MKFLYTMTYADMADLVQEILFEIKRRNPIGVNLYTQPLAAASNALKEISMGEVSNFTSEVGPKEVHIHFMCVNCEQATASVTYTSRKIYTACCCWCGRRRNGYNVQNIPTKKVHCD